MITSDVQFRRGIFNILHTLKASINNTLFNEIIDNLEEKMEQIPANDLEQSKQFFFEVTNSIIKGLEEYYEITHEQITNDVFHGDSFTLKVSDDVTEMMDKYSKYRNMARFRDSFLQSYNYDFWRKFRAHRSSQRIKELCTIGDDNSLVLTTNKIPVEDECFLPKDNYGRIIGVNGSYDYFSNLFRSVSSEMTFINDLRHDYDTLNNAVRVFNERLEASLREEHIRFGIIHLKEILANIIVPVALIEDDKLRELCKQHGRQVFVKTPRLDELMYVGSSVHIYSAHDMNDDASYIAKPIIISDTLPTDTEELKYLGVGQYTEYDDESPRSLDGANPYIINNNIYVKASYEDFLTLIPDELVEEMGICKNLLESMENPVEDIQVEENETLKTIIDTIKEDKTLDHKKVIDDFMASSTYFEDEEDRETGPIFVHEASYQFDRTTIDFNPELLKMTETHPNGFVIVKDNSDNYAGIRINDEGTKEIYINTDWTEVMKALQLRAGLYTIYSFRLRGSRRQTAIHSIKHFNG